MPYKTQGDEFMSENKVSKEELLHIAKLADLKLKEEETEKYLENLQEILNFADVINVEFTAKVETEFDNIAEGQEDWKKMIGEFYGPFEENVERVEKELEHVELVDEVSDIPCDKCGRMMVYKYGRFGKFLACPGYPECKNTKPIIETIEEKCPKCGGTIQVRKAKSKRKYYICENNPKSCDYISWNKPSKENK